MLALLNFLKDFEPVAYFVLAAVSVRFFIRIGATQLRLEKTLFGLEQGMLRRERNTAFGMLLLLGLTAAGVYVSAHVLLPEAQHAEAARLVADPSKPTAIPTPTPYVLFGVDVSGCANPHATILNPKPGDTVQGRIDIRLTADPPGFAFYRIELGNSDLGDVWMVRYVNHLAGHLWDVKENAKVTRRFKALEREFAAKNRKTSTAQHLTALICLLNVAWLLLGLRAVLAFLTSH